MDFGSRYHDASLVATGGMSRVYRATDQLRQRDVAIKLVDASAEECAHVCLRSEASILAQLGGLPVAHLVEEVQDGGNHWLVLDWVDGKPLSQWAEEPRTLTDLLDVFRATVHALAALHDAGVAHGDLKPANIIVKKRHAGRPLEVVLIDLGLAERSGWSNAPVVCCDGFVSGTPEYMAPELFAGSPRTPRCDVYAAAVILYELLTGAPPFCGRDVIEVTTRQLTDEVVPLSLRCPELSLPTDLDDLVVRALDKDPRARQDDAAELSRELAAILPKIRPREALPARGACGLGADAPTAVDAASPPASARRFVTILRLTTALVAEHRLVEAAEALHGAIASAQSEAECPLDLWRALVVLAAVESSLGNQRAAIATARHAIDCAEVVGSALGARQCLGLLARLRGSRAPQPVVEIHHR